jgi:hypothetical protein
LGVTQKLQTAGILDFMQHREIYPMASVPQFESNGNLPPGIHWTSWDEFVSCFDTNSERHKIISGLREAIELLRRAGCRAVYIGGSLVTNKESPNDFDACWDGEGVSPTFLYHLEPALVGSLEDQKARFGGELSRAHAITAFSGKSFLCFLQSDKNNNPKGVIAINLREF